MYPLSSLLSGIRLVSWDVDGTLFSYFRVAPPLARWLLQVGAAQGWTQAVKLFSETLEFHRVVEAQRRLPDSVVLDSELDRFNPAAAWERAALDAALRAIHPRRAAVSMIERIAAAGIPQVALSDFECGHKLEALGLDKRFSGNYSCRSLGFWKPSPFPLARVQQDFGVAAREHLHIGDRVETDGAACAANGCRFLHISRMPALLSRIAGAAPSSASAVRGALGRPA